MNSIDINAIKTNFKEKLSKGEILSFKQLAFPHDKELEYEKRFLKNWYNCITSLNFLNFDTLGLEEITIHSPTHVNYKFNNYIETHETDLTWEDLQTTYEVITLSNGIEWNYEKPFVSFDITKNAIPLRITLSHFSLTPNKTSKCFIRLLNKKPISLNSFDTMSSQRIINMIKQKKNILIAGSTGSGKTTFLNSLLQYTDHSDHLLILEDVNEIIVPHKNCTKLLSDHNSSKKSLKSYMNYCMRMSPERIVIGELRAAEIESYLLAMNTGHQGLLSTIHANSAKDALDRVALLFKIYSNQDLSYELVLKLVCKNIDAVVFLENKKVKEMIKVYGSEKENAFYEVIQ